MGDDSDFQALSADSARSPRLTASKLEAEKSRLYEEIRNYPTPIAACDQQFNYLLEQHARVIAQLHRLRAEMTGSTKPPEQGP